MSELEKGIAYVAVDGGDLKQITELKRLSMVSDVIYAARKVFNRKDLVCMWVGGALVDPNDEFAPFYTCDDNMVVVLSSDHTKAPEENDKWKKDLANFRRATAESQ